MPADLPAAQEPAIRIRGVQKVFSTGGREVKALDGIDLDIAEGEFVCLLGPSGCGKSTLLNAIAGFSPPTAGSIVAGGRPVTAPGPDRAMVFQEYALFPWMTVEKNVAFGLEMKGTPRARIRERVDALLAKLNLRDFRDRFPKDLSGGMRQRVAIARVLAIDSPMLLMDEPFGALDEITRARLDRELRELWQRERLTVLFVTHSIYEAVYLSSRVVVMGARPGRVVADLAVDDAGAPRDEAWRVSAPFLRTCQTLSKTLAAASEVVTA
jgi:NitT/TauT family transport system ATP-binding protein